METLITIIIALAIGGLVLSYFLSLVRRKEKDDYIQVCKEGRTLYTNGVQQGYMSGFQSIEKSTLPASLS